MTIFGGMKKLWIVFFFFFLGGGGHFKTGLCWGSFLYILGFIRSGYRIGMCFGGCQSC